MEETMGKRIREYFHARGETLESVSRASGINMVTLSALQNDKIKPRLSTLEKLAQTLEIPLPALFPESPPLKGSEILPEQSLIFVKVLKGVIVRKNRARLLFKSAFRLMPASLFDHPAKEYFLVEFEEEQEKEPLFRGAALAVVKPNEIPRDHDLVLAAEEDGQFGFFHIEWGPQTVSLRPPGRRKRTRCYSRLLMPPILGRVVGFLDAKGEFLNSEKRDAE